MHSFSRVLRATLATALVTLVASLAVFTAEAASSAPGIQALRTIRPAATPQGPVQSTACTGFGTGIAACDLWAKPGTATVSGTSIPIWGLASTDAAAVSTPGPVLVVKQGDTVTITIHNGLLQNLALALPHVTGTGPTDTTGTAPGTAKAYTFTAGRPGSYLYEAGHTPDGARQAAMGIVGAMIVRPADGSQSAYGNVPSAFDDEAVLVLSEIDPAFNANPMGFDLRNIHPTYRLINGKAFPETTPVATDSGRRVLLRYVNAGLVDHAMGVLGTRQTMVGTSARANLDAFPVVAETIPVGDTEDGVVVVPPAADGTKFAVYETAGKLDNAGAFAGVGSTKVAIGGMMTFLTTTPVPPTTSTGGPVVTSVTVSPLTVTALQKVTIRANITAVPNGSGTVTAAEYVVDHPGAVAVGTGTPLSGAFGAPTVTNATATLDPADPVLNLSQGVHTVYVRARDTAGNWGPVNSATFTLSKTGPVTTGALTPSVTNGTVNVAFSGTGDDTAFGGTVDKAEFFVGSMGASGTGTPLTLTPATTAALSGTIPTATLAALPEGIAHVFVHSHDTAGLWGPALDLPLTLDKTAPTLSGGSVTPSPNNGTTGSAVDPTQIQVIGTFTDPVSNGVSSLVVAAEGFLDNPQGTFGSGLVFVANDGKWDSSTKVAYGLIPLSQLTGLANGTHTVYVHARDAAGNWGPLAPVNFVIDRVAPVVTSLTATPTTVVPATTGVVVTATATDDLSAITAGEWFWDTDPGVGKANPMTVTSTGATSAKLDATAGRAGLAVGQHVLSVRARDAAGNWSAVRTVTVTVSP